ncbi:MAG: DUF2157 domain-containing protein [Alphaproteobacteria bacterium]|nr:DUF2157 domain-containing protein [Alphaproteobacteria bacterium]
MRPPFYVRQLKIDLEAWIAKGLVPAESRDEILASVGAGRSAGRLETILAVFGVILVGAGVLSFVGANWAAMTKPTRLLVLFGSMWLAYALAIWFTARGRELIGQAFVLLGVILFGSNIWFVAQTYNINSHYPDGTLLWGAGALAAAFLVPSRAALAAAMAIGAYWTWQETMEFRQPIHLEFLVFWALGAALAGFLNWRPGIHLAALALIFWFAISFEGLQAMLGWSDVEILTIYVLIPLAVWSACQIFEAGPNGLRVTIGHYAFFAFLVAFAVLHLPDTRPEGPASTWLGFAVAMSAVSLAAVIASLQRKGSTGVDVAGTLFACLATIGYVMTVRGNSDALDIPWLVCTLIVILWSISRGARMDDRFVINWSTVAFGLWVLYAYFELFAGLMDQAVFFTVGGILLIALALGLENLRRSLVAGPKPTATSS